MISMHRCISNISTRQHYSEGTLQQLSSSTSPDTRSIPINQPNIAILSFCGSGLCSLQVSVQNTRGVGLRSPLWYVEVHYIPNSNHWVMLARWFGEDTRMGQRGSGLWVTLQYFRRDTLFSDFSETVFLFTNDWGGFKSNFLQPHYPAMENNM